MTKAKSLLAAFALPLAATLAACNAVADQVTQEEPPLAGARLGGAFTLVNSKGEEVTWDDFRGKYAVFYFGYAYCPDVCPLDVQRLMQGYAKLKKEEPGIAAKIQPVFVTVDPERDTPAVVGEFTSAFSADLLGLTGTVEQVNQAAKAFAVYHKKGEAKDDGAYLVDHSRAAYLMGPDGQPLALLPVDQSAQDVAQEMKKWVR